MHMIKICTVTTVNKHTMTEVLSKYGVKHECVNFTNNQSVQGFRILIPFNMRLFFTEIIMPEYNTIRLGETINARHR